MSQAEKLFEEAKKARNAAHSPYSTFKVGSAVLLSNGKIYSGCNIENASYGGTVCAERVAVWKGLSENPGTTVKEVCVITDAEDAWPPCGFCRQVLAEFSNAETVVYSANLKGIQRTQKFTELLPNAFGPQFLK